jgi:hypothetical protein
MVITRKEFSMTKEQLAELLDGMEYGQEFCDKAGLGAMTYAHDDGLIIIYGQSDDLLEFEGAIREEVGAWGGTSVQLYANDDGAGVLPTWESFKEDFDDEDEYVRYFHDKKCSKTITAEWDKNDYSWWIETAIPFAPFDIMEDGGKYCRAIVISLDDI